MLNRSNSSANGRCAVPFGDYPPLRPKKQNGRLGRFKTRPLYRVAGGSRHCPDIPPEDGTGRGEKVHLPNFFFPPFSHFRVERADRL
jgi:hypothetical protein